MAAEDALRGLIDDNPDDLEAYRAYGDWLEQQGDPRSQLMAMHLLRERLGDRTKLEHLEGRIEAFFEEHRAHFLGPLAKVVPKATASKRARDKAAQRFTWKAGFIRSARIGRSGSQKPAMHEILTWLLDHPSGRFLVDLEIDAPHEPQVFADLLAARAPRSLRSLVYMTNHADLGALWQRVPHLEKLVLVDDTELGDLVLPALREARLLSVYAASSMRAIARACWPQLETLEIELRGDETYPELRSILEREDLPRLRTLALGTGQINDLVGELATLPLARQLTTLDLGHSYMFDDTGAASLAASGLALDELRVHVRSYLTPSGRALLRNVRTIVDVEPSHYFF